MIKISLCHRVYQYLFLFSAVFFAIGFGLIVSSTNQLNAYNAENHDYIAVARSDGQNPITRRQIWRSNSDSSEFFINAAGQELRVTFSSLQTNPGVGASLKGISVELTKVVASGENFNAYYKIFRYVDKRVIKYIIYDGPSIDSYTDITTIFGTGQQSHQIAKHASLNSSVFVSTHDGWTSPNDANFYVNIASMLAGEQHGANVELTTVGSITLDDAKELFALIEIRFAELDVEQWATFGSGLIRYDNALGIGLKLAAVRSETTIELSAVGADDYFQLLYKIADDVPAYWGIDANVNNYESAVISSPVNARSFRGYVNKITYIKKKIQSLFRSTLGGGPTTATKQHANVLYEILSERFELLSAILDGGWVFESDGTETVNGETHNYIIYNKDFIDSNTGDSETVVSAELKLFLSGVNKGKVSAYYTYLGEKIFATGYGIEVNEEEFSSVEELSNVELINKWFKCKLIIQAMMIDGWRIESNVDAVWNLEKTLGSYVFRVKINGPRETFEASGNFQITLLSTQNDSIYAVVGTELDLTSDFDTFTTVAAINSLVYHKLIELIDARITATNSPANSNSEDGWDSRVISEDGFYTYTKTVNRLNSDGSTSATADNLKLKLITTGADIGKIVVYKEGASIPSILSESSMEAAEIRTMSEQLTTPEAGWTAVANEVGLYTKQFYATNVSVFLKFETVATDTFTGNFKIYVFKNDEFDHSGDDDTKAFVPYSIGDDATDIHTEFDSDLTIKKISVMLIVRAFTADTDWNNESTINNLVTFTRTISSSNLAVKITLNMDDPDYGSVVVYDVPETLYIDGLIGIISSNQFLTSDPINVVEKFIDVHIQIKLMDIKLTTRTAWSRKRLIASNSSGIYYYQKTFTTPNGSDVEFFIELNVLNADKFELYTTTNGLYNGDKNNALRSPTKLFLIDELTGAKNTLETDVLLVSADYEIAEIAIIINMYLNDIYLTTNAWATSSIDATNLKYTKNVQDHEFVLKLKSSGVDVNKFMIEDGDTNVDIHSNLATDYTTTDELITAWFVTKIAQITAAIETSAWSTKNEVSADLYRFTLARAGTTFYLELKRTGDDVAKYTLFTTDGNSATSGTKTYYTIDGISTGPTVTLIAYTDSNNAAATILAINAAAVTAINTILTAGANDSWTVASTDELNTYTKMFGDIEYTLTVKKTTAEVTKFKLIAIIDNNDESIIVAEDTVWVDYATSVTTPITTWVADISIVPALVVSASPWSQPEPTNNPNTYKKTYSGLNFFIDITVSGENNGKYTIYTTSDGIQTSPKAYLTPPAGSTSADKQLISFTDINVIDSMIGAHLVALIDTELLATATTVFNPIQWTAGINTNSDQIYKVMIYKTEFTLHLEIATGKIKLFHSGASTYLLGSMNVYVDYYDATENVTTKLDIWNTKSINTIKLLLTGGPTTVWRTDNSAANTIVYTLDKNPHTFILKLYTSLVNNGKISLTNDATPSTHLLGGDEADDLVNFVNIATIDAKINTWLEEQISIIVSDLTDNSSWDNEITDVIATTKTFTKNVSGTEFTLVLNTAGTNAEKFQVYTNDYGDGATKSYVIGDINSYHDSSEITTDSAIQAWINNNKISTTLLGISLALAEDEWVKTKTAEDDDIHLFTKIYGNYTLTIVYDTENLPNTFRIFQYETEISSTTAPGAVFASITFAKTYVALNGINSLITAWFEITNQIDVNIAMLTNSAIGWSGPTIADGVKTLTKTYIDSNSETEITFKVKIYQDGNNAGKIWVVKTVDTVDIAVIGSRSRPIEFLLAATLNQTIELFLIMTALELTTSDWAQINDDGTLKVYTQTVDGKKFTLKLQTNMTANNFKKIKLYVNLRIAVKIALLSSHDTLTDLSVGWISYTTNEATTDRITSWFDDRIAAIKTQLATISQDWILLITNDLVDIYEYDRHDKKLFLKLIKDGDHNAQYVLFETVDNTPTATALYFDTTTLKLASEEVFYEFSNLNTLATQTDLYYKNSELNLIATQLGGWTKMPDPDSGFELYTKIILGQEFTLKLKLNDDNAVKYQLYIDNSEDSDFDDVFLPSADWFAWTDYETITTKINTWNTAEITAIESVLTTPRILNPNEKNDNNWSVWTADSDNPNDMNQNIYTQILGEYTFTFALQTRGDDARKFMVSVVHKADGIVENPYGADSGLQNDFSGLYTKLDEWLSTKTEPTIYAFAWVFGIGVLVLIIVGLFDQINRYVGFFGNRKPKPKTPSKPKPKIAPKVKTKQVSNYEQKSTKNKTKSKIELVANKLTPPSYFAFITMFACRLSVNMFDNANLSPAERF